MQPPALWRRQLIELEGDLPPMSSSSTVTKSRVLVAVLAGSVLVFAAIGAAAPSGGPGNDLVRGTPGADKLYGRGGNDRLFGLGGNDLLVGGSGNDALTGGAGADRLSCGPGRDTANADRRDRVARDCESVRGTPRPPPSPTPPPPPLFPGEEVDVGGYSLYMECSGTGSPTVVLEAGLGAPSATLDRAALPVPVPGLAAGWRTVRAALASETRVCAYDRAGLGRSDRRPSGLAPSAATYSRELRTLLTNANVPGPYVFYGARFGGLLVLSHTLHWPNPNEIVGIVFSEALSPCPSACTYDFPPEHAELDGLFVIQLGARPVVVLTSQEGDGPEFARRSTNSIWASAPGVSTYIPAELPQLTVDAIRVVVAAARTGANLPLCEQTPLPRLGVRCESFRSERTG